MVQNASFPTIRQQLQARKEIVKRGMVARFPGPRMVYQIRGTDCDGTVPMSVASFRTVDARMEIDADTPTLNPPRKQKHPLVEDRATGTMPVKNRTSPVGRRILGHVRIGI
jgi:hypothetical protein